MVCVRVVFTTLVLGSAPFSSWGRYLGPALSAAGDRE